MLTFADLCLVSYLVKRLVCVEFALLGVGGLRLYMKPGLQNAVTGLQIDFCGKAKGQTKNFSAV